MVVGSGMLAKAFDHFRDDPSVIIFASGVSKSREDSEAAFDRERNLLASFSGTKAKLVYFSTISVEDPSLQHSHYVKHKLALEQFIEQHFTSWLIFRLPNLIGASRNPHTLANFIYDRIRNGEPVPVYAGASRFFMDVADVSDLLTPLIADTTFMNRRENLFIPIRISIKDLVEIFENVLGKKAIIELKDAGSEYYPDSRFAEQWLNKKGFMRDKNYYTVVISKYYPG